jgi:hypothetical protein
MGATIGGSPCPNAQQSDRIGRDIEPGAAAMSAIMSGCWSSPKTPLAISGGSSALIQPRFFGNSGGGLGFRVSAGGLRRAAYARGL